MDRGVTRMAPAGDLAVPAYGSLALDPGGVHIMLMGLRQDLPPGSPITLILRFERAGGVAVTAQVR